MRIASRTIASAAVVALLSPLIAQPAHAQRSVSRNDVAGIQILVRAIDDKTDGTRINPGGTVSVAEGARVRVNVEAALNGSRTPMYPVTEFTDLDRGGVRITRGNAANAAVDLEVISKRNPNRIQRIGYRITDNRVPANLRTGTFNIQVVAPNTIGSNDQNGSGYGRPGRPGNGDWGNDRARDLTRVLYQGILMREPDPSSSGTLNTIRNGGYNAVIAEAVNIANSRESRYEIPGRRVSAEDRLAAMYQSLLGLSPQQADPGTWRSDLRLLSDGQIARVVEGLVRSDRFRSHYGLTGY
ncbi:MAG TPA: hypothetical protein VLB76_02825 [Thermoanaerobaculia bacterium]|jgi:hypothetical protein|nr:hypothetical protein [Thermoanaerobaculia bacterium]